MSDNQLELISLISEFNELHEFMHDEQIDRALELIVKLIVAQGDIPTQKIPFVIVELQALATKFAIQASYYGNMGKGGVREAHIKNVCYTMKEAIGKLVDSLKYIVRASN